MNDGRMKPDQLNRDPINVTEPPTSDLPSWVCRSDGKVVPFDPDRISQAIFLATEVLQQPNAFLARELADGVLHFVAQEHGNGTPTTDQISELIVKVLRELGQAALAHAYEQSRTLRGGQTAQSVEKTQTVTLPLEPDKTPEQFTDECRRLFSRHRLFSRDLMAAQDEGFLSLAGLEHPAELAGGVISWTGSEEGSSLLATILESRRRFGGFIVLDSLEHAVVRLGSSPRLIRGLVDQIQQGLVATGLKAIVNLNAAEAPPWAQLSGQGPLFQTADTLPDAANSDLDAVRRNLFDVLMEHFSGDDLVRVDWHLGPCDFQQNDTGLTRVLQAACQGRPVSFVFDRPGAAPALAEGVDRRHPALLQVAGLHLTRLADMDGVDGDIEHLLVKLLHLAQMAMSAAVQKRRFLREMTERRGSQAEDLRRGFFLDRARLSVVPVGLPAVVRRFADQGLTGKQGLSVARQILERLGQCLRQAGRGVNLDGVLDSPWWTKPLPGGGPFFSQPHLTGLTSADFSASAEDQLRAAGSLHQFAGGGTATLLLPADLAGNLERLGQLLHYAWKKTSVVRVRLARIPAEEPMLNLPM